MKAKAILLAGERGEKNPLLEKTKAPCKALVPVRGIPMIKRVVSALVSSPIIEEILLIGPKEELWLKIRPLLPETLKWIPPARTPSLSTFQGLEILGHFPVFLTTADHALLTPEMIEYFLYRALRTEGDLAVGIARFETLKAAYPEAKRTTYRLKEGRFCSTNLYAFLTPAAKRALLFWRQIEKERKKPLKVIKAFGVSVLAKYLAGRLGLEEAFAHAGRVLGCRVIPVIMPYPEAAIDVDDPEDLALAEKILDKRGE